MALCMEGTMEDEGNRRIHYLNMAVPSTKLTTREVAKGSGHALSKLGLLKTKYRIYMPSSECTQKYLNAYQNDDPQGSQFTTAPG